MSKTKDEDDDEDDKAVYKRVWYAPWKKVKKGGVRNKKVPEDWLKTEITKGLSEGEVSKRREQFGWNELTA